MKRQLVLHPFLFGAYPVMALLAFNIAQSQPSEALRSILAVLLLTAVLLLLFKLLTQNWYKAGLITAVWLFFFLAYGHLVRQLAQVITAVTLYDLHRFATAFLAAFLILWTWGLWRVVQRDLSGVTSGLNWVTAVLLILPLFTIITQTTGNNQAITASQSLTTTLDAAQRPDIYYIILDAYTSGAVLHEIHNYNNTPFLNALRDKGFYIAENSHSNYARTRFSISSSLNYDYVPNLYPQFNEGGSDLSPLTELIQHNRVSQQLQNLGYQTIAFTTGFAATEIKTADIYYSAGGLLINEFEEAVLGETILGTLYQNSIVYGTKRQRINYVFEQLKDVPSISGPKFVFLHVMAPHSPFVFTADGQPVAPDATSFYWQHALIPEWARGAYSDAYLNQLQYINHLVEDAIIHILAQSATPPIIIIQGDHGSRTYWDSEAPENSCLKERMSILNAYFLPGIAPNVLYDTITPVNSFRLVFDSYFSTDLGLLADKNYTSPWSDPYNQVEITGMIEESCTP